MGEAFGIKAPEKKVNLKFYACFFFNFSLWIDCFLGFVWNNGLVNIFPLFRVFSFQYLYLGFFASWNMTLYAWFYMFLIGRMWWIFYFLNLNFLSSYYNRNSCCLWHNHLYIVVNKIVFLLLKFVFL